MTEVETASTSTSSEKDRMEATAEASKILSQGKRNLVCGEVPTAVNQFQEACKLLAKAFGETAKECAEAYFYYGQSLLDLARMETGVLGNALQGVPEEDEEEATKSADEQFGNGDKLDVEEREKLRIEVYDAMAEKEKEGKEKDTDGKGDAKEKIENGNTEKKEQTEKAEVKMDTETDKAEEKKNEETTEKGEQNKEEKDEKKEDLKEAESVKDKDEEKMETDDASNAKTDDASNAKTDDASNAKTDEASNAKTDDANNEKDENKEEKAADEEQKSGEEEDAEEGDDAEGDTAEEGETGEEGEDTAEEGDEKKGNEEDPDDVSNLQLAWEMLELAKVIYLKEDNKESKLKAADSYLKLGEVSLETEQYEKSIADFNECLNIQKTVLEPEDRSLAETYYQLGLAYCFNKQYDESIDSYRAAIKVLEDRIAKLSKVVEGGTEKKEEKSEEKETTDDPVKAAETEITEIKELLPDMRQKIEDAEEEKKNYQQLKEMAKEAIGFGSESKEPEQSNTDSKPASNISHLIRRKRKPDEDESVEQDTKKTKQDDDAGDAVVNGGKENGVMEVDKKKTEGEELPPAEAVAS